MHLVRKGLKSPIEWIAYINDPHEIESLTQDVFKQGVVTEAQGYFQIILELGSGSDQELLEHYSFCLKHPFSHLNKLNKDIFEYQSWSLGKFTNPLAKYVPKLLALDTTLLEMRASLAILNNLERLQRNWCDIPLHRLSVEANIRKDSLKKLLANDTLTLFSNEKRAGDQYRFTIA